MIRAAVISLACATPVAAEDLRPAPEYFVDALFATSMAQALAEICEDLGLNFPQMQVTFDTLNTQLSADGFDTEEPFKDMQDMTGQVHQRQSAFLEKHPIEGATPDEACAAARSEMAEGSAIGALLMEEPA